jgi:pyrimidine-nucleoside phosphorylase
VRAVDLIARKRDGDELSAEELRWLIRGVADGSVTDYQAAAWLMAVYLRGMTLAETSDLTIAMAESGHTLDLGPMTARAVDKHSTGGIGDKVSLVVGPIAAAAGVVVPKMSGRGLGITGGTLVKLESIPGFRVDLTESQILAQAAEIGLVITGQTANLAPADGILYALRDVTATVECLPLIVSSILSKKLAGGAPSIVLDVKFGSGALMKTRATARELAKSLVDVGTSAGRRVVAYLTRMEQPLGFAVGNALEVREAIDILRGGGPAEVQELALRLAAEMISLAGIASSPDAALSAAQSQLDSGAALAKLGQLIAAQGGDPAVIDDPSLVPASPRHHVERSTRHGWISGIDAGTVGQAVLAVGAGRAKKTDAVDHGVGIVFAKKVCDEVGIGDELYRLYVARSFEVSGTVEALNRAYTWSDSPVAADPLLVDRVIAS